MDYEITATLGPASQSEATWAGMLAAGATGFRLNTSHLSLDQLDRWLGRLDTFLSTADLRPPIVLDLQGSKWRLGQFASFELVPEQQVDLIYAPAADRPGALPVPHADFFQAAVSCAGAILLNDARAGLRIETAQHEIVRARVVQAGPVSPGKGITLPSSNFRIESLNEKDKAVVSQTQNLPAIRYALSYVKDAAEMARYRALFDPAAYLVAKIERQPAAGEAAQIAAHADELWLCRGDLGAELGMRGMAQAVHDFSSLPGRLSVPVQMAGQVLEHMSAQATPTRSEVCYLYETLLKGYRGVVLSDETAVGRYPVESCRTAALFKG